MAEKCFMKVPSSSNWPKFWLCYVCGLIYPDALLANPVQLTKYWSESILMEGNSLSQVQMRGKSC